MALLLVETGLPIYLDRAGSPLQNGKVWYGVSGLNPVTNPVAVFWDAGGTQPAAQPVSVSGGRTVRSDGTPARVWLAPDYSKLVLDGLGQHVSYELTQPPSITGTSIVAVDRFSGTGAQVAFTLSTAPDTENSTAVYVAGVYQQKNTYSVAGNVLTFVAAPVAGVNNIEVNTIGVTDYGAAVAAVAASQAAAAASAATADTDAATAHADRLSADTDAAAAAAAKAAAVAASEGSGPITFYDTMAAANAGLAGLANLAVVEVFTDETRGNRRTRYRKEGGVYVFKLYPGDAGVTYYISNAGNDSNSGVSDTQSLLTIAAALAKLRTSGDRILLERGSVFREQVDMTGKPDVVLFDAFGTGPRPIISGQDIITAGSFVNYSGNAYTFTIVLPAGSAARAYPGLWEDNIRLAEVIVGVNGIADAAAAKAYVVANAGTFYFDGPGTQIAGWSAGTKTYYMHASDNSNPGSNGKVYEAYKREFVVYEFSSVAARWRNIHFQLGYHHDGMCDADVQDCAISRVARHAGIPFVPVVKRVISVEPNPPYSGSSFHSVPVSTVNDSDYEGCIAVGDETLAAWVGTGFFSHGNDTTIRRNNANLRDCQAYNLNTALAPGVATNVNVANFRARNFCIFANVDKNAYLWNVDAIGSPRLGGQQISMAWPSTGTLKIYSSKIDLDGQYGLYSSNPLGSLVMEDTRFTFRPLVSGGADAYFYLSNTTSVATPLISIKRCVIVAPDVSGFNFLFKAGSITSLILQDLLLVNHKTFSSGPIRDPMCTIGGVNVALSTLTSARVLVIDGGKCLDTSEPGNVQLRHGSYVPGDMVFSGAAHPGGATQPRAWVAVGDAIMAGGPDPGFFTQVSSYTPTSHLWAVCFVPTENRYVAVGDGGLICRSNSSSSTVWAAVASGTATRLRAVCAVGATVIAVGDSGMILRSTDNGATWAQVGAAVTASNLRCCAFNGTTVVAAGDAGTLLYSTDSGATWAAIAVGAAAHYALFYSSIGSTFLLGSEAGAIRTCAPANVAVAGNWTSRTSGTLNRVVSFAVGEGKILAALYQTSLNTDTFLTSTDSTTWVAEPIVLPYEVRAIAGTGSSTFAGDPGFVAVGEAQSIALRKAAHWNITRMRVPGVITPTGEPMAKWKAMAAV